MADTYRPVIEAEVARWPGVRAVFSPRRKHRQVALHFDGRDRFVVYASTPGEYRGLKNTVTNVRAVLRGLGAMRA